MHNPYTNSYYESFTHDSYSSARIITKYVMGFYQATSVVDLGCGIGRWLEAFLENGVADILGVDGVYVDRQQLKIPVDRFVAHNLETELKLGRSFDLAISVEVAEHLSTEMSDTFVQSLVTHAPVVLFSAAIPHQGGENHYNEQWPEYWRAKFNKHGYQVIDCIRRKFWDADDVDFYYAQNILIFASNHAIAKNAKLKRLHEDYGNECLSIVHPKMWEIEIRRREHARRSVRAALNNLFSAVRYKCGKYL